jgi:hypothetical protein
MTPDTFEDRLLAELRQVVAARPQPVVAPAPPHRARPRLLAGGLAATAAVAAAAVVVVAGGGGASPAYAVERQADGSVEVTINSLSDAAGLERKLQAAGIPALVRYLPDGKMCRIPAGRPASGGPFSMGVSHADGGATTFTIPRGEVKDGQKLLIQSSGGGNGPSSVGAAIVAADTTCDVVDAPGVPAGAVTSARTGGPASGATRAADHGGQPSLHTGP